MTLDRELGRIEEAILEIEDHGVLTFWLMFDFGGSGQGFGGYTLDAWNPTEHKREGTACGTDMILRILHAVGVTDWNDLEGKEMWVERDENHIIAIEAPKYRKTGGRFDIHDWQNRWFEKVINLTS